MPFLSPEFALLFVVFLPLYWACANALRVQNALLLILSLGLLMYVKPSALVSVIIYSLFIKWLDSLLSDEVDDSERQSALVRGVMATGIVGSVLFLASMKYFDDYAPLLRTLLGNETLDMVMPLGLSYYTFQALSYLIERYRGHSEPLPYPELLLHFSFFLTITAGPIIRAGSFKSALGEQRGLIEQLATEREFTHAAEGLVLILLGLLKAWVLSAQINHHWVRPIFENPLDYSVLQQISAWYGYTFQLYFDFSGYSDLVLGLALMLGFQLPQNFDNPLNASNIQQFWNKWHISLSTWIRDYIYIPLGGSRAGFFRTQINLLLAFTLSGVWHGSSLNFLLWGLWHGMALVIFNLWRKGLPAPQSAWAKMVRGGVGWFLTFHFVVLGFVMFRTTHLQDLPNIIQALWLSEKVSETHHALPLLAMALYLALLPVRIKCRTLAPKALWVMPVWLWFIPITLLFTLLILLAPEGIPEFIYANF